MNGLTNRACNVYAAKLGTFARVAGIAVLLAACVGIMEPAQGQTLTFTVETSTADGRTVTPRLTWVTEPAAISCSAEGAANWSGVKAAAGTEVLPAISATATYFIACDWASDLRAIVEWTPPTTNTDGTPYSNPGGYIVLYGQAADLMSQSATVSDPATTSWTSPTLAAGSWFFAVRAVNAAGIQSENSQVGTKELFESVPQERQLTVVVQFPNPPGGIVVR